MTLKSLRDRVLLTGLAIVVCGSLASGQSAEQKKYNEDLKKYNDCVAKVRKDYPVPNGNVNTQKQMIQDQCGQPPTPPKK